MGEIQGSLPKEKPHPAAIQSAGWGFCCERANRRQSRYSGFLSSSFFSAFGLALGFLASLAVGFWSPGLADFASAAAGAGLSAGAGVALVGCVAGLTAGAAGLLGCCLADSSVLAAGSGLAGSAAVLAVGATGLPPRVGVPMGARPGIGLGAGVAFTGTGTGLAFGAAAACWPLLLISTGRACGAEAGLATGCRIWRCAGAGAAGRARGCTWANCCGSTLTKAVRVEWPAAKSFWLMAVTPTVRLT